MNLKEIMNYNIYLENLFSMYLREMGENYEKAVKTCI